MGGVTGVELATCRGLYSSWCAGGHLLPRSWWGRSHSLKTFPQNTQCSMDVACLSSGHVRATVSRLVCREPHFPPLLGSSAFTQGSRSCEWKPIQTHALCGTQVLCPWAFIENRTLSILGDLLCTCGIHSQWQAPSLRLPGQLVAGFPATDQKQTGFSLSPLELRVWSHPVSAPPLQGAPRRSCLPGGVWSMERSVCGARGGRLTSDVPVTP